MLDYAALWVHDDELAARCSNRNPEDLATQEAINSESETAPPSGLALHLRVIKPDGRVLEPELVAGKPTAQPYPTWKSATLGLAIANIAPVGTAALGAGLWGQLDLVGNVTQWNLDYWSGVDVASGAAVGTNRALLLTTDRPAVPAAEGVGGSQPRVLRGDDLDPYDTTVVPTWRRDNDDPTTSQGSAALVRLDPSDNPRALSRSGAVGRDHLQTTLSRSVQVPGGACLRSRTNSRAETAERTLAPRSHA